MSSLTSSAVLICTLCVLLCLGSDDVSQATLQGLERHKMVFHPNVNEFHQKKCEDWNGNYEPESDNTTQQCHMDIAENETIETIVYDIINNGYNFVHLYLQFFGNGNATYTKCVIEPQQWVWTFGGSQRALQYLKWPPEYIVWSMGLLATYSQLNPYTVNINVHEDCPIFVGRKNTTGQIGLTLSMLSKELSKQGGMMYDSSYFCFKTRTYIENEAIYKLCLNVICPLEATGYICCHMEWNYNRSVLVCPSEPFMYDAVWWIVPFVVGSVLFAYFPVVLLLCAAEVRDNSVTDEKPRKSTSIVDETTPLINTQMDTDSDWLYTSTITVWTILAYQVVILGRRFPTGLSRTFRFLFVIFSLSFIVIKVVVHYRYQNDFVVASVAQGTPMDFLSVLAGYEESKQNFLRSIGGPYEACVLYLIGMIIFMVIPRDLSKLMETSIPYSQTGGMSPLIIPKHIQDCLGSVNIHETVTGYRLVYRTMTSNFFMLLNSDFWAYTYRIQKQRFCDLPVHRIIAVLTFPLYCAFCLCEICACIIYFGLPIIFFIAVFLNSYISALWCMLKTTRLSFRIPLLMIIMPMMLGMMTYIIYMFSIIFVGSFIFLSRVAIFTYTGLFAFPNYSYGYIIFSVTIMLYIRDVINHVRDVYRELFLELVDLCSVYQTNNANCPVMVFRVVDRVKYIPGNLFFKVVKRYQPTRLQIIKAFIKIMIVVFVLFISVYLITNFQRFKQLSILTQSVTTLFVCLLPKLLEGTCSLNDTGFSKQLRTEVMKCIDEYCSKTGDSVSDGPM
ncbi:uncharacterized protein LOC132562400 [Ylistrum balloti]|uniref:uncharacterized protein LOC132562400 n=1 Tax=Ylistrum balloti TaxID=509963 RepID=UPI002905C6D5|nr:uncharacterized protein LOC132562400 [Ylistrum balloti]